MHDTQQGALGRLVSVGLVLAAVAVPATAQEIFSDGFESGNTIAWSDLMPSPGRQVVFEGFFSDT